MTARARRGSVVVFVAAGTTLLLAATACVADVAVGLATRARLQAACDAGALAGAAELAPPLTAADRANARAMAVDFVKRNGFTIGEADVSFAGVPGGGETIRVDGQAPVPALFSRIIGTTAFTVKASASARLGGVNALHGALPFALPAYQQGNRWYALTDGGANTYAALSTGEDGGPPTPLQLKVSGKDGHGGNCLALALGGQGAATFRDCVAQGLAGTLAVGDAIDTEPGNMVGPTAQGVSDRLASGPEGAYAVVPLIAKGAWDALSGRTRVTILGFASVKLLPGTGKGGVVQAEMTGHVVSAVGGPSQASSPGLFTAALCLR